MRFLPHSIVAGAVIIAAAMVFILRFDIAAPPVGSASYVAYRLDRMRGEVAICAVDPGRSIARNEVFLKCQDMAHSSVERSINTRSPRFSGIPAERLPGVDEILGPEPPDGYVITKP